MTFELRRVATALAVGTALSFYAVSLAQAAGVTLTVWHNTSDPAAVLALYAAYEKASGNKLNLVDIPADGMEQTVLTKWASGDRPDILEYHPISSSLDQLNASQTLIDLTGEDFVKQFIR